MKHIFLFILGLSSGFVVTAQELVADQNPNYTFSRDKYMNMADSINASQSTTQQSTYKAIDFLVDRAEAKAARKENRRQYRAERGYNYNYYPSGYYPYSYFTPRLGYQWNMGRSFYQNSYRGYHNRWNNGRQQYRSSGSGIQLMFGTPLFPYNSIW